MPVPTRSNRTPAIPTTAKVDDTVTLGGAAHLVRTPDGGVTTTRADYTFRVPGEHVIHDGLGKELATVKVTKRDGA